MMRPRRTFVVSTPCLLENRCLLTATPSAVWLGQDGHDYAGGATPLAGNGVQDIHIVLSSLPDNNPIKTINMTGDGGGQWLVNIGPYSPYNGVLFQAQGATTADLYIDPYQTETGRNVFLTLTYDDGTTSWIQMAGGTANPNLRMPADAIAATWLGQDGHDLTGPGPDVGPNGNQDAHVVLTHLFPGTAIQSVTVTDTAGPVWESGVNPGMNNNAEFVLNASDPTQGDLYFSPIGNMSGQVLTITIAYADGKTDQTTLNAGATQPNLPMPTVAPADVIWGTTQATWLGQDGLNLVGPGDVHVALSGLPAGRSVVAATLSDTSGLSWYEAQPGSGATTTDPFAQPLGFQVGSAPGVVNFSFPPARNETGATLTLVVTLDDGSTLAARLAGGFCDPGLRAPGPAPTSVVAHPGDDLNALANSFGTVRLSPGVYPLTAPLVLEHPVTLVADPGVTLQFSQASDAPTWTTAITVDASHTTLEGFAVRFTGPVRWTAGISYGPAVIGTPDNFDPVSTDPRLDLTFSGLDLQDPPASTSWEAAPSLLRLTSAESGQVINNTLKGGTTEFFGGPWLVADNTDLGTLPNTYTDAAFATHYTHDVTFANNLIEPTAPAGKTWRFLVMTQSGFGDVVRNNTVIGVGPMNNDTVVNPNAPEVILTEAYTLKYEGMIGQVSNDGNVIQIPAPQGGPARTGDVLAILTGPLAGQYRTIASALGPETYVLDAPIQPGRFDVSIATGFVGETYEQNTVDSRGSSTANDLVLAGNQFGARIVGNHFLGGNDAFELLAYPSQAPVAWGWTHAPFLGATVDGNTVDDTVHGGIIDVSHSSAIKTNIGRVYFSGTVVANTGVWDAAYLAARTAAGVTAPPSLLTIGDRLSNDPGEMVLTVSGNTVQGPSSVLSGQTIINNAGTINGTPGQDTGEVLPTPSSSLTTYTTASETLVSGHSSPARSQIQALAFAGHAVVAPMFVVPPVAFSVPEPASKAFPTPAPGAYTERTQVRQHPQGPLGTWKGRRHVDSRRWSDVPTHRAGIEKEWDEAAHWKIRRLRAGHAVNGRDRLSAR